jgi:hypothetical protein
MKSTRQQLWVALVALALGATLLHLRIHPPDELSDVWPNLFSVIDLVVVSLLFLFRSTAILGVILNSFLAFLGIIMMADFSLSATLAGQVKVMPGADFFGWLLQTTFADITILVADFLVGLALYRVIMTER